MRDPLANCSYNKAYKSLKELSQNGENFCKQITSVLQQRANLEISYAKGLQKLATKLSKVLQGSKKNCLSSAWSWASEGMKSAAELHQKLGKAIELEAIKPTHQVLSMQEKKRKSLDNEVEKIANLVVSNWNQQIKAKKKLMVSTKKHEALFHLIESSKQSVSQKEKQKLLNKLKKSTENLEKEDENYYQKNMAGYSTRLKWENTLEKCYKSILELEKERIQLLCNNLNQYSQHISLFGQTLTTCHTQIHCAISKVDVEKDIQTLMEETAMLSTENKSEFLLTDYFEEDPNNAMDKERRKSLIKPKLLRLQRDIEKASKDNEGLERMLNAYSSNSSFSDEKSQKDTAALMDEYLIKEEGQGIALLAFLLRAWNLAAPQRFTGMMDMLATLEELTLKGQLVKLYTGINLNRYLGVQDVDFCYNLNDQKRIQNSLKLDLLQANSYKLSSVLAELEQRTKPSHPCSNSIFKWKEKDHTHTYVKISRPFLTKRLENVSSRTSSGGQKNPSSSSSASGAAQVGSSLGKALYSFQARQDDELNLEKGDIVTIHEKKEEGWWFGSLNGKKGHFPAAYVEELPSKAGNTATQA